ncbi:MAG: 3-isopropylmalate dehydrogenase [Polyangiaceae bacterium]|nr:3-isopropylmalate dehydrogenase [Polyangiaceae bacterium]
MKATIVLLPGDGIGPEIVAEAQRVLERVGELFGHEFTFDSHLVGGASIDACGVPVTERTMTACRSADAILLGAVGGPQWDDPAATVRPEQGLFALRERLGLYANIRPVRAFDELGERASPLRPERAAGVDIVMVRELTGGLYFGTPRFREVVDGERRAVDTMVYTELEIRRVVRRAFEIARSRRRRLTSVDKANVLECSRLWRQVVREVADGYPDVKVEHQLVDSCAMRLVTSPASFDVIVTENLFGDILSDEAAVVTGSLGMLPSASLGDGRCGLYEPIHGSAPDIAGRGIANPLGTILSAALLLEESLGLRKEAAAVERAVLRALASGARTADLGGGRDALTTRAMGEAVLGRLERPSRLAGAPPEAARG